MTKFVLNRPDGPWDYPSFGFRAAAGAILDGTLFTPAITEPPDRFWSVYNGGSAQAGITLVPYNGTTTPSPATPETYLPIYRRGLGTFQPTAPAEVFALPGVQAAIVEAYNIGASDLLDELHDAVDLAVDISNIDVTDDAVDVALRLPGGKSAATLSASIAAPATLASRSRGEALVAAYLADYDPVGGVVIGPLRADDGSDQERTFAVSWSASAFRLTSTGGPHQLTPGQAVRFDGKTGMQFTNGGLYFVREVFDATTFTVYGQNGTSGNAADMGDTGTASAHTDLPTPVETWTNGGPNPVLQFSEGFPVQAGPAFPAESFARADPATVTVNPIGTTTPGPGQGQSDTGLAASCLSLGKAIDVRFHSGGSNHEVYVDGRHVFTQPLGSPISALGGTARRTLKFPSARPRVVTTRKSTGFLPGFATPRNIAGEFPAVLLGMLIGLFGDSFTEAWLGDLLKRLLGINIIRASSGSTGYAGVRTAKVNGVDVIISPSWSARLDDITGRGYDGGIAPLGINDLNPWIADPAGTRAKIEAVHDALASLRWAVVPGPFWPNATPPPQMRALDAAIQASAEAHGLPWFSPIQEEWVTADNVGWVTGSDNTHPTSDPTLLDPEHPGRGELYYAGRLAGHIAPLLPATR